ncbi:MAG: hypothetical protein IJN57_06945 [Oscillospiraceae bacterium]|nr:hypothetical protein [Oscillospiraceae bacterium]
MIKGTDVYLYHDGVAETVHNVLVGEPSEAQLPFGEGRIPAYTLAIPKGDTHDWTDRIVGIFGRLYRTVGSVAQGIEENIPTAWHKKIRAELLVTTGDCTVYEKGTFRKHVFRGVFFCDHSGEAIRKDGAYEKGGAQICIYSVSGGTYVPKSGDLIVEGDCPFTFDLSGEETASHSMAAFRSRYHGFTADTVIRKYIGEQPDYEITAR